MNSSCSDAQIQTSNQSDSSEASKNVITGKIEEMTKNDPVVPSVIDVSYAGGQVLRIVNALSFLLKKPVTVKNVRTNKHWTKRGLSADHVHQLSMVVAMSNGRAEGNVRRSTEYTLRPCSAGTEGFSLRCESLFVTDLQAVLPCLVFAKEKSTFHWQGCPSDSHQTYFCQSVLRLILAKFGVRFDMVTTSLGDDEETRRKIVTTVHPAKELTSVNMTTRDRSIKKVRAMIFHWREYYSNKRFHYATKIEEETIRILKQEFGKDVLIHCTTKLRQRSFVDDDSSMSSLVLKVVTSDEFILPSYVAWIPSTSSGYRLDANTFVTTTARKCKRAFDNGVCISGHLTDQVLVFMALAKGKSTIRSDYPLPDDHWKKAISAIEKLLDVKFSVEIDARYRFVDIACEGIGMQNKNY
ncbi:RNA 3'-terminal phosphate cyclase-like isoform X2 [Oscarella lobularis]|uniref:RNA 3'-terminal phosphate cyclase-like isoform X2 n=1 Tax=Oscarella lobularis TaxID=121494 RepID=UPI003313A659